MKTALLIAVMLAVVSLTPAWCQGGPGGPGCHGMSSTLSAVMPPHADMIDGLTNALSLTTDQAASLKTILTDGDTTIKPLLQASADAAKALRDAVLATTYDSDTVADASAASEAADAAAASACIDVWVKIRDVLTSDQIALLQSGPSNTSQTTSSSSSTSSTVSKHR